MEKNIMHCPNCHNKLADGEPRKFETLSDHVCDPNRLNYPLRPTFICTNPECFISSTDVFWDESGDLYGWIERGKVKNDLTSAYPSISRRLDIEIYKKGLKKQLYLHPALMLWFLKPLIEFNYKADDYGNILKRSYKLKFLRKDSWNDKFGYHIYYTFPLASIFRSIKYDWYKISDIKKNGLTDYKKNQLKEMFKPIASWDKRWWKHTELFISKIIFKKWYFLSKNL